MTRYLLIIGCVLLGIVESRSQQGHSLAWAKTIGGSPNTELARSIATDAAGNVYATGYFGDTVDFDPGPGVFKLISFGASDIFIVKYNAAGNFVWAKQLGGPWNDYGNAIAVDAAGNVYSAGGYQFTADFDPGPGVFNLTTPPSAFSFSNAYVSKLDANGNFIWAKGWGGNAEDEASALVLDAAGNVHTTGNFYGTVDFDPGAGVSNITSNFQDIFVSKLNANGVFMWAKKFEGASTKDEGLSIAVDNAGNVFSTGFFTDSTDFDPGPGVAKLVSGYDNDIYISKLDGLGNFVWVKHIRGFGTEIARDIALDRSNNIYLTGEFGDQTDFDPGSATFNMVPFTGITFNTPDMFVCKFTENGNLIWAKQIGNSSNETGRDLVVDHLGSVYITGDFISTVDFDPGPATFTLSTSPAVTSNPFICKLDAGGNFVWAKRPAGTSYSTGYAIAMDLAENFYISGTFSGTSDLDPGPGTFNVTSTHGLSDDEMYISRFSKSNEISGICFHDMNGDGIRQADERKLPGIVMKATINGVSEYGISDSSGTYFIDTDMGSYTITPATALPNYIVTPATHTAAFGTSLGQKDTGNHFAFRPQQIVNDLAVTITAANQARPGFRMLHQVTYTNSGTTTLSGTVTLSHAASYIFNNAVPAPASYAAPLLTWNYSNLQPLETRIITIELTLASTTPLNTVLESIATINPVSGDTTTDNNTYTLRERTRGSFDPNDKTVTPDGNISPSFISSGDYLDYTIRFQNTGTDTAFNIVLTDTLSSNTDISSFQVIATSHPHLVRLSKQQTVEWIFNNILLPDSTTNELKSHGFVRYRIKPRSSLVVGNQVKNKASIYFDYNVPVVTNETLNTVTIVTAVDPVPAAFAAKVFPNPSRSLLYVQLNGWFDYTVYDMMGKQVSGTKRAYNTAEINVGALSKGIYILKIKTSKTTQSYKFVLQ